MLKEEGGFERGKENSSKVAELPIECPFSPEGRGKKRNVTKERGEGKVAMLFLSFSPPWKSAKRKEEGPSRKTTDV